MKVGQLGIGRPAPDFRLFSECSGEAFESVEQRNATTYFPFLKDRGQECSCRRGAVASRHR